MLEVTMMYHMIVFESLRCRPSTSKPKAGVSSKISTLESVFEKMHFSVIVFIGYACGWYAKPEEKNIRFQIKTDTCGRGQS